MSAVQGPEHFKANADAALADRTLKVAIDRTTGTAERRRAEAVAAFPAFEATRERGARIKDHVIANLGHYLEEFERNAVAAGAVVHWAATADEACRIVVELCRAANARRVTRVKSMLGEEIGLPHALAEAGIERIETDLAEHIVQLAGDTPSHIVWPAMHRTREQVSALFKERHRVPHAEETVPAMVESARRELREKFLTADVGISGANFLIADTGAVCTVTNEGNAELGITPPRVHIVTAGIEKLVPSMAHCLVLLRLLVRSATGAELTQYTTFTCGPKRPGDADGPGELHIVLVDNGRTRMLAEGLKDMLRCIRCGACMNHCVVYRQIGGHAYGAVYPGPMGAVITPVLAGLDKARELPHACTLNGRCAGGLPGQRSRSRPCFAAGGTGAGAKGLEPAATRAGLGLPGPSSPPARASTASRVPSGVRAMRLFRRQGWIRSMPLAGGWTRHRDLPAPHGRTFMELYRERQKAKP